jgi:CRP-like cAMP-binding protein
MMDDKIERIINFLDAIFPMSEPLKEALRKNLVYRKFPKGQMLLKDGQICTNIYFIVKGLVKIYITNENGEEIIIWFMMKDDVMVGVDSFFIQQPGEQYIETLKETEVLYITHECLYRLFKEFPEFNLHRATLSEKYYTQSLKREIAFKKYNCDGRYRYMLRNYPELVKEMTDGLLASYLGMTASHLSHIKSNVLRSLS